MGRVRLRAARLGVQADPLPLLPGHEAWSDGGEPNVRVLLAQGAKVATIGCATRITVSDGRRFKGHLPAGHTASGRGSRLPVRHRAAFARSREASPSSAARRAPLTLGGRPYRGDLVVRSNGATLSVINALELDTYVRGVVPSESPAHWPIAELKAQAVAARSYAVAQLRAGRARTTSSPTRAIRSTEG